MAAERGGLRAVGGASSMPSPSLLQAAVRAGVGIAQCVIVDAPPLFDDRTRALADLSDRVLVVGTDDPVGIAALGGAIDERWWLVASRCAADRLGPHAVLRSLPEDVAAVRSASHDRSDVGGALGRAYDDLAELLAIDVE